MDLNNFLSKIALILFFSYIYYINNYSRIEKSHIQILRKTASECTLFLNKNNKFPINQPCNVLLIGSGARYTVKGGLGSGDVDSHFYTTCEEGLEKAGFKITTKNWLSQYIKIKENNLKEHMNFIENFFLKNKENKTLAMVSFPEVEYNLKYEDNGAKSDIAIYVLGRNMGEGIDRRPIKGEVFLTDTEIRDILYLDKKFKKFMLVLNVGGVVDLSPVKNVSNILLLSQLGVVTGDILADIILGKTNPSGKLATTWAAFNDYKFINEFGNLDETNYKEGVYVGYRYFNSAGVKPLFPFGFGKSYSEFIINKIYFSNIKDEIFVKVGVKNIGEYPGKEVVQIYVSPSQENEDKPYQSLVAFKKTEIIKPNCKFEMILTFKMKDIARYDTPKACYILDKGNYTVRVGNSSDNTKIFGFIELNEDIITEKLKNIIHNKPDFQDYKPNINIKEDLSKYEKIQLTKDDFNLVTVDYTYIFKTYNILSNFTDLELIELCLGDYYKEPKDLFNDKQLGYAGITTKKNKKLKHYLNMADGPAGLRLNKIYGLDSKGIHKIGKNIITLSDYNYLKRQPNISLIKNETMYFNFTPYTRIGYQYTTAIPIATALAQSFNIDFVEKIGKIIGKEMNMFNVHLWLAPALNIHRNILCGRNFEYFSEDPLISGKMAGALTRGVQSYKNTGTTIKHFAANNQEFNRINNDSKMSERALREIYLKGFKIAIEESNPHALMTSYNLINGVHTAHDENLLIDVVRCEWKYDGLIMTDWSHTGRTHYLASKKPPLFAYDIIMGGVNIMMPGGKEDYEELVEKLNKKLLTRKDLLHCASKVYETIELLNK